MIVINKKQQPKFFDGVNWVCKAIAKNYPTRESLTRIHIIDVELLELIQVTACDGHRVHRFIIDKDEVENINDGLYTINKKNKTEIRLLEDGTIASEDYPDINKFIRDSSDNESIPFTINGDLSMPASIAYARVVRKISEDKAFNIDCFSDLLNLPEGSYGKLKVCRPGCQLVMLGASNYSGFLMPISIYDPE